MSEFPAPGLSGSAVGDGQETLTPEAIEAILADFRSWLQRAGAIPPPSRAPADTEPIDLHTLLAQFVALRHEVNLQTKAVRAQQEQNAATLEQLNQALELLERKQTSVSQAEQQVQDEAVRPLLKTLVDAYGALARGASEVERVREAILLALGSLSKPLLAPPQAPRLSIWSKWFGSSAGGPVHKEEAAGSQEPRAKAPAEKVRQLLESVLTGYTMSVQRIERALQQAGLESIPCAGRSFDPELMEVVAVVSDSGRPSGEVIEEVRRGYRWRGRVFRYAQVSVAKS